MQAKRQESVWNFRRRLLARLISNLALIILLRLDVTHAQLAITEVMSSASTNLGSTFVVPKSDFWELTNFGTNVISLEGYSYSDDASDPAARVSSPFHNCFIGPGESIIFLRTDTITNRQDFFNWWGAGNLKPNLQVRTCPKTPGLNSVVDAVQVFDPNGNRIDRVDFGLALRGHTFTYNPATGEFGAYSALGGNGAFKAVASDDIGSPGVTTGPIPLSILQQPTNTTQDAGLDAEFSVRGAGFPRPSYQWFWNGSPIPGAIQSKLVVSAVQPSQAGNYTVLLSNGVNSVVSSAAALTVNTNPSPATILVPPSDAIIFEGQSVTFSVKARGYPPPLYQWQTNGVNIPGATNSSYVVSNASLALNGTIFSVHVYNIYASTNASARLQVTLPPDFVITEVMAAPAGGAAAGHEDWFELTNHDTNAVNLLGYRFAANGNYSFDSAFTITNPVVIEPGESIIFVKRLTSAQFKDWWGAEQLPPKLKIVTYDGFGLSSEGDLLVLWNSAQTDPFPPLAQAAFPGSTTGFSMRLIPPDYFDVADSVLRFDGAFRALNGGDVGSPGYTTNPAPRFVSVIQSTPQVLLQCRVIEGKQYTLQAKASLSVSNWTSVSTNLATNFVITIPQLSGPTDQRFFILKEVP